MSSNQEDLVAAELLDRLNREGEAALWEAKLMREYAELLALLPYELEPVDPPTEIWQRIETDIARTPLRLAPEPVSESTDSTLVQFPRRPRAIDPPADPPAMTAPSVPAPVLRPNARVTWAIAAVFGACLLGIGYLLARAEFQQSTIDALRHDLVAEKVRSDEMSRDRDQLLMINRTARQYYPMRPVSTSMREEPVYGRVWVCGQHQRWQLNLEGLKPAPAGYEYRFWFDTSDGKIAGGTLKVGQDRSARLEAMRMPRGTSGFFVTLEPRDAAGPPTGQELLRGDAPQQILGGIEDLDRDSVSM